jgi:hypothetical protein
MRSSRRPISASPSSITSAGRQDVVLDGEGREQPAILRRIADAERGR